MRYQKAYLHLFNRITDLLEQLESLDLEKELVDVPLCLKAIQAEAEEVCIAE